MRNALILSMLFLAICSVGSPSHATVDVYNFGVGASANFPPGDVESISGSFDYNTTTNSVTSVSVTLSGSGQESGSYTKLLLVGSNTFNVEDLVTGTVLALGFEGSFGPFSPSDPLAEAVFEGADNSVVTTEAVTGGANIASAVPEPSTWAMMILGFFGVGFMAYRRNNRMVALNVA